MNRIAIALCIVVSFSASAKTYTAQQLTRMVSAGEYPTQAAANERAERMDFRECVRRIQSTVEGARPFPVETIVDREIERGTVRRRSASRTTRQLMQVKIWTRDAVVTMTCSEAEKQLTVSEAPYQ